MSQRTEQVRREYTDEGGQRIRTTSITDSPAPRRPDVDPRHGFEKRPGRTLDDLSYPGPGDED